MFIKLFSADESGTSDSSGSDFYHAYACNIRRSATLYTGHNNSNSSKMAALNSRYNSSNSISAVASARVHLTQHYNSATLGRMPRTTSLAKADYTR